MHVPESRGELPGTAQQQQHQADGASKPLLPGDGDIGLDAELLYEAFTDTVATCLATIIVATQALAQSVTSPVVIGIVKRTSKTVILTAVCHYMLLSLVLLPLSLICKLVSLLTLFLIRFDTSALVHSSMSVYPLVTLLLIKFVYRSSMEECFSHTLQQLEPGYAARLASQPRRFKPNITQRLLARLGMTGEESEDLKTMLILMVVGMLLHVWRGLPYVGWIVAPVIQFMSIRYMVGHPVAAATLSLLAAFVPPLERPVMAFVELWASSTVLGRSSMRVFLERAVPRDKRTAFIRRFEPTVVCYFLLPTALMRLPVLGSLVAFPAAAMGAHALTDILQRVPELKEGFEHVA